MNVTGYTDEELYELWEERAAVFEYDGGLSRKDAEYRAAVEMRELIKPRPLPEAIWEQAKR